MRYFGARYFGARYFTALGGGLRGRIKEPDTGRKTGGTPLRVLADAKVFALHSKQTTRFNAVAVGAYDGVFVTASTRAVGATCHTRVGAITFGISACTARGRISRTVARHPDARGAHHLRLEGYRTETSAGTPDVKNVSRGYPVGGFNVSDAHFIDGRGTTTKAERPIIVVVRPRVGV